ncbi:4-oxalomesaconate tautomerase [Aureimonas sp. Leaf324]|jgi:2-methylaconitate cis-trans-isomerase PrpF|uniref:4-oxalomesaconate tautomerase n=1 Tax=Aureimonas sp. Leaf324 TaxID=1736336 RepID=UPI0006F7CA98|nr:4-oxalomesaconate tautomerase [Aureimonas sp. Leaf324]KQQ87662.1 4-oxalomesaconate tautomerase [Aureimonas sp. Leaf324]
MTLHVVPERKLIPTVLMRGGTSRGPFILERDLPADPASRDRVLIEMMGSPHPLQVNGIGGGDPLTSKVAIISPSTRPGIDVEYLFAQVGVTQAVVDTNPNCGNMLSAVGPFAIEAGLVQPGDAETTVRIFNRNTGKSIHAVVQTPGGAVTYDGSAEIDGVAGSAAPIKLTFLDATGSKTSGLFPTGERRETIDGIEVSLVDYAMPMMLVRAADVGLAGNETPDDLDARRDLFGRLEIMRREAGRRMGLGDVSNAVVPKIGILSEPRRADGTITSRYLVPHRTHKAHAVTGALCVAVAARTPGTIAFDLAAPGDGSGAVLVEHPSGKIGIDLETAEDGTVRRASLIRTARRIFEGNVILSGSAAETADAV